MSPTISYSFGDDDGRKGFIKNWELSGAKAVDSELWQTLEKTMALGGTFQKSGARFEAPYVFSKWPENLDSFENVAIIAVDVNIRARPSTSSPVLYVATYEILSTWVNEGQMVEGWTAVNTPNGQKGYVKSEYARSPIDYRAGFEKRPNGQWIMTFFIAGD